MKEGVRAFEQGEKAVAIAAEITTYLYRYKVGVPPQGAGRTADTGLSALLMCLHCRGPPLLSLEPYLNRLPPACRRAPTRSG